MSAPDAIRALLLGCAVPYYWSGDSPTPQVQEEQLEFLIQHSLRQTVIRSQQLDLTRADEDIVADWRTLMMARPSSSHQNSHQNMPDTLQHDKELIKLRQIARDLRRIADDLEARGTPVRKKELVWSVWRSMWPILPSGVCVAAVAGLVGAAVLYRCLR